MELIKKLIQMNQIKCKSNTQMTLDDDFNVPDAKPDVAYIIKEQGMIHISEVKAMNGKAMVKGSLDFMLLYISEEGEQKVHNISGSLPFEEQMNMDEACTTDNISCQYEIEDLSTSLINSRKISVRATLGFYCSAEEIYEQETGVSIDDGEDIYTKNRKMNITALVVNKKDTLRIKDEITLPSGKAEMEEILYQEGQLRSMEYRMTEDGLQIGGELSVFFMYSSPEDETAAFYYTIEVPFQQTVECDKCDEDMIPDLDIVIHNLDLQAKPDDDGEQRIADIEAVIDLDIKVYEQEELEILEDAYALREELEPATQMARYERLLVKNNSKVRVSDQVDIDGEAKVLQLCHASGALKTDEERIVDGGVEIDGVVEVGLLYITDDDEHPLGFTRGMIPFTQLVEVRGMNENCTYKLHPSVEQISVNLMDGREAEVRATIAMDIIAFDKIEEPVITQLEVKPWDEEKWQKMPGLVGYIATEGDTLWSIARNFGVAMEDILELNGMESDKIVPGQKMLLMKKVNI